MDPTPRRLLITGVTGFVGLRLARAALARGHEVVGLALGDRPAPPGIDHLEVDLTDRARLAEAVGDLRPDAIVHLAALTHVGESWKRLADYFRVNVLGTEYLLAAAAGAGSGARRPRVLFASSAEVYGAVPEAEQPIAEDRTVSPMSPYALTKAAGERLALAAGAVVVRSFNLVGAGQGPSFALPSFARQLAAIAAGSSEPVIRVGNLEARRDFLHVDDGVDGYLDLAGRGEAGQVYNLARGEVHSMTQMLGRLQAVAAVEARVEVDPERVRPADMPLLHGDARRISALGWRPRRDLDEALDELWCEARAELAAGARKPA